MPGGTVCSVAICKQNSKKTKKNKEHIMFFTFPKDSAIRNEWIKKCYRKDKFSPEYKRICSLHFKLEDYEDELQARLTGSQPKKLKKTAIPSLHLLPSEYRTEGTENESTESAKTDRCKTQERQVLTGKILQESNIVKVQPEEIEESESTQDNQILIPKNKELESLKKEIKILQQDNQILIQKNKELESLKKEVKILQQDNQILIQKNKELESLKKELKILQEDNQILTQNIELYEKNKESLTHNISKLEKQLKEEKINFEEKLKLALKDFFTPNEVDILLKKKRKARWTVGELSKAFTVRYFSKRCYIYLRETLHYPLPGLSTLQQWAGNINLRSGCLEDVLRIMNTAGQVKNDIERTTILCFDEMKVSSMYEYDQTNDEIVGLHSYMQVIMARGLFDKWKQPVYIGFDQKVTKSLLEKVITKLHESNYNVVACTSDCGGSNQGLWKEFNINIDNTSIEHPVTKNRIYFFADVPHLLKLLRNWFLDTGFILSNGEILTKDPVKKLLEVTRTEINSCYKLTQLHLKCQNTQRQNVRLAAQLFSNTTATALKHYLPGEDQSCARNVGEFFKLINTWFDIMNSYTPITNIPSKKPYGLNIDYQNEALNEMLMTISSMLCVGKTTMQVFQKGIIISTKSLISLFEDLKRKLDITYILTHRLNQDCLENLFSQLRTRGGLHDHPSPLNALYRIRMILLGKNPGIVQTHSNVESSPELEQDEYILATALKQAHIVNIQLSEPQKILNNPESETSGSSGSTTTSLLSDKDASEKDGLIYIAGYLAKRHLTKYPHLGQYTYKTDEATSLHSYSMPSWLQSLSFGGLVQPSTPWVQQVNAMEKYFLKFHKEKFKRGQNIVNKTKTYITKCIKDVPPELVKDFCRQRLFIRIKFLNLKREEQKLKKRKISSDSKIAKKLQKIMS